MLTNLAVTGLGAAAMGFILVRALAPFKRIWRGDAVAAMTLPTRFGRVEARNYLAYLVWVIPGVVGLMSIFVVLFCETLSDWVGQREVVPKSAQTLGVAGFILFLAACPLALVHVLVNAIARPRFLVPRRIAVNRVRSPHGDGVGHAGDLAKGRDYSDKPRGQTVTGWLGS